MHLCFIEANDIEAEATIIANGADATNTYDTACPADSPTTEVEEDVRYLWSGSPLPMSTYVPRQGAVKTPSTFTGRGSMTALFRFISVANNRSEQVGSSADFQV